MDNNVNQTEENVQTPTAPPQYFNSDKIIPPLNNNGFISDDNLDSTNKILSLFPYFLNIIALSSILSSLSILLSLFLKESFSVILAATFIISLIINIIPFAIIWHPKPGKIAQKLTSTEKTNLSIALAVVIFFFNSGLIIIIIDIIIQKMLSKKLQPGGFYANILKKSSKTLIVLSVISIIILGIWLSFVVKMFSSGSYFLHY